MTDLHPFHLRTDLANNLGSRRYRSGFCIDGRGN
jgi:hypothetical protein